MPKLRSTYLVTTGCYDSYEVLGLLEGPPRQNVWGYWKEFEAAWFVKEMDTLFGNHRANCTKPGAWTSLDTCVRHGKHCAQILKKREEAGLHKHESHWAFIQWLCLNKDFNQITYKECNSAAR